MEVIHKDAQGITIRFDKKDLAKIAEPIVKNAESFAKDTLDIVYLLAEQDYRTDDHFEQPPHVFD
ncbi:conserved protein of unknown function [Acidithiobacillus ferrivorans]|uniref:Uncharacterized protein n=2 Tax=Acidithiobacillus ferrivorans TaxID=160808 RepID=A0A060UZC2_9PROT|nr:hypothetical protein [Acidithiobacillus ferrivorans]MBN6739409.1 hypothetical protein [Acidithiobacillus sp. MC6.1]AEM48532.1 hypothetical protein Acife_2438 [Acidithiobacillus ferrivorans SS3]MBU2765497.1 hypothetical protein [Acidithiobacillus ferrivorans]MBU2849957.1 hypothetical protein [Acidithiobacillus ferrivorans]OCB02602.1 hypothetical protein BBC27_12320 [Acidithiobacillus ferrivorans]